MGPGLKSKHLFIRMKGELNAQTTTVAPGLSPEVSIVWGNCLLSQQVQGAGELQATAAYLLLKHMFLGSGSSRQLSSTTGLGTGIGK